MTTILILKGGCYSLHPSNNNGIGPRMKGYLYFPRIPFRYKISRRITDHPRWLFSIVRDRNRRPEGGEWEPIKISSKIDPSAYIPKSPQALKSSR